MEYLTIAQFAARLQVDERTVQRWISEKAIKYVRIKRTVRIPANQLAEKAAEVQG
jgi:excisionase family DNA binding protein